MAHLLEGPDPLPSDASFGNGSRLFASEARGLPENRQGPQAVLVNPTDGTTSVTRDGAPDTTAVRPNGSQYTFEPTTAGEYVLTYDKEGSSYSAKVLVRPIRLLAR